MGRGGWGDEGAFVERGRIDRNEVRSGWEQGFLFIYLSFREIPFEELLH